MGRKTNPSLDDCRTRHDYIQYVKDTEQAWVSYRDHSNYAGIATPKGAVGIHDDNKTLPKEDRTYIKLLLLSIGIACLVLLWLAVGPTVAQALGAL